MLSNDTALLTRWTERADAEAFADRCELFGGPGPSPVVDHSDGNVAVDGGDRAGQHGEVELLVRILRELPARLCGDDRLELVDDGLHAGRVDIGVLLGAEASLVEGSSRETSGVTAGERAVGGGEAHVRTFSVVAGAAWGDSGSAL